MSTDSLYAILGVDPSVSDEQLLEAFEQIERKLAGATDLVSIEDLRIAKEAFAILSSRRKRGTALEPRALPKTRPLYSSLKHAAPQAPGEPSRHSVAEIFLAAIQRPAFLAFLAALVGLLIYRDIETTKSMVEIQRLANEKAVAEARDKMLEAKEAEAAEAQRASNEKKLESETKWMDVGQQIISKQIELGQQSVNNTQQANTRQADIEEKRIEAQKEAVRQEMELVQPRIKAEANALNSQARQTDFVTDQWEYERRRQDHAKAAALNAERVLYDRYREQQRSGDDRIGHSNPGLSR